MNRTILPLMVLIPLLPLATPAAEPVDRPSGGTGVTDSNLAAQELNRRLAVDLAWSDSDARQKAMSFLNSNRVHREAIGSLQQCRSCHGGSASDRFVVTVEPDGPW